MKYLPHILLIFLLVFTIGCVKAKEASKSVVSSVATGEIKPDPAIREELNDKFTALGFHVFNPFELKYVDFELEDLDGKKVKLSDYPGKVIFLNFWATWCGPCRSEMPAMEELYQKMRGRDFVMLAVDLQEDPKDVANYMKNNKLTFPVVLDRSGEVGGIYNARSIPTTYIFDKLGYAVAGTAGAREWSDEAHLEILSMLAEENL